MRIKITKSKSELEITPKELQELDLYGLHEEYEKISELIMKIDKIKRKPVKAGEREVRNEK